MGAAASLGIAAAVEAASPEDLEAAIAGLDASSRQRLVEAASGCSSSDETTPERKLAFESPKFPMYVVDRDSVLDFECSEGLPHHESLRKGGLLLEVVPYEDSKGNFQVHTVSASGLRGELIVKAYGNTQFTRRNFLTVSHQWLRPNRDPALAHPDSPTHEKLRALQRHLQDNTQINYVWMDWLSIPQRELDRQADAIASLPYYFTVSTITLILCSTMGDLEDRQEGYLSRGWCKLELLTTRLPRIDTFECWYAPGFETSGDWGSVSVVETGVETGATRLLSLSDFVDAGFPLDGHFTNPNDAAPILDLLEAYVEAFDAFGALLAPLRTSTSWRDFYALPAEARRVQTWKADRNFGCPMDFAEFLQAPKLVEALRANIAAHRSRMRGGA